MRSSRLGYYKWKRELRKIQRRYKDSRRISATALYVIVRSPRIRFHERAASYDDRHAINLSPIDFDNNYQRHPAER
ncbi:hypothetical protein BRAS3843_1850017 [Bradyrhizobium sp. STM 3843]|nr:hypothetical protein BRAS3843_1850017 [Bradyrhizobium sp. STM 3843]